MSTASSPTPTRGNTTRQQLDELDALLQRMLSLPLNQPPEGAPPEPEPPTGPTSPTAEGARPAPQQVPEPPPPPPRPPAPPTYTPRPPAPAASDPVRNWTVDLPVPAPATRAGGWAGNATGLEAFHLRTTAQVPPTAADRPAPAPPAAPPPLVVAPPAPPRPAPAPAPARVRVWQWPLVGLDAVLTLPFALLGPLGRALTGSAGRTVLGVVGLLCLMAAAAVLALDGFGWTW